jgi:hypothetical protein
MRRRQRDDTYTPSRIDTAVILAICAIVAGVALLSILS